MNHRETPQLSAAARRALRCITLLLLPALAPEAAPAQPRHRSPTRRNDSGSGGESLPYLTVMGSQPLRFQRGPSTTDLLDRPVGGAPPLPPLSPTESTIALANASAIQPSLSSSRDLDDAPVTEVKSEQKEAVAPVKTVPAAILPDDTRPSIRAEDFLPFFQIPGAPRRVGESPVPAPPAANTAPAPATLPPSSASYTQTPK
jgi:hypothetical protein